MIRYIFHKKNAQRNTFFDRFSVLNIRGSKRVVFSKKSSAHERHLQKNFKMIKTNILWSDAFSTIPAKILAPFHWCQFHRQLCHYDQPFYDQNLANKLRIVFGIRQLFGSKDQASIEPMRQFAGYDPNHQSSGLELFWKKNNTFIMLELFVTKYIQCNVMDYGQHKDEKCKKN